MQSPVGKFLVAGKAVRILYAAIKACAFCGLALLAPFPAVLPSVWVYIGRPLTLLTYGFVYAAVALCILRGLPVIVEFVHGQKEDIVRSGHSKT
jgi:CDP-diacylglycerol--glycerol-3-phosphate 3-phosphatidyltransferase